MGTVFYFSRWALAGARPMAVTLELSGTGWVVPKPLEIWRQVIETRTVSEDRGAIGDTGQQRFKRANSDSTVLCGSEYEIGGAT